MRAVRTYWACPDPSAIVAQFIDNPDQPIYARNMAIQTAQDAITATRAQIDSEVQANGCRVLEVVSGEPVRDQVNWSDQRVWYPLRAMLEGNSLPEQVQRPYSVSPLLNGDGWEREGLTIDPSTAFTDGIACLRRGDFVTGLKLYEFRWQSEQALSQRRPFTMPMWDGSGQHHFGTTRILVHAEQGYGDVINFARWLSWLKSRSIQADFLCYSDIAELMTTLDGFSGRIRTDEYAVSDPIYDYHLPLCSLPLAMGLTKFGSATWSYLSAPHKANIFRGGVPNVGICWSGREIHANNAGRSVTLEQLLKHVPSDSRVFNLQLGPAIAQLVFAPIEIIDLTSTIKTWSDTAVIIEQMDLIVSVDTGVAHLAGAMGKPVKLILAGSNDWRWQCGVEWYPSMEIIRSNECLNPKLSAIA